MKNYPNRLIKTLFCKYITQDRIPLPSTLEGKNRWIVSKTIKRDVKSIYKWSKDKETVITGDKPQLISRKLRELYMDACAILNENTNERAEYYIVLTEIRNHEIKIKS